MLRKGSGPMIPYMWHTQLFLRASAPPLCMHPLAFKFLCYSEENNAIFQNTIGPFSVFLRSSWISLARLRLTCCIGVTSIYLCELGSFRTYPKARREAQNGELSFHVKFSQEERARGGVEQQVVVRVCTYPIFGNEISPCAFFD